MKPRSKLALAVLFGGIFSTTSAQATVIKFSFTGEVTQVNSGVISDATTVGDAITGMASYDTSVAENAPGDPTFSQYANATTMSLTLNGQTWSFGSGFAQVVDRMAPRMDTDFFNIGDQFASGPILAGSLSLLLRSPNTVLTSDALPTASQMLNMFGGGDDTANLTVIANDVLNFRLTSGTLIPEPGTLAIFGLGLAGLGLAGRRKAA